MQQSIAWCLYAISFFFILKLIFFLSIPYKDRSGFLSSFVHFFSKHDVYNAASKQERRFIRVNNNINFAVYLAFSVMIYFYMTSTNDINGLFPTKRELKSNRIR